MAACSLPDGTFSPILILIPVRLGVEFNMVYAPALKVRFPGVLSFFAQINHFQASFSSPYSMGIAGGRPNMSLYFVGVENDQIVYLDPHYTRPTLEVKPLGAYIEEVCQLFSQF